MKTSKKALAFALAAAMVVTAVPVTNAEAASTAKLSATKATLYTGQSKTITLKTPSSWKSVKTPVVKTGKKSVATVKKVSTKKYTVKAVKAGTTKVYVKVTAKKNGKTVKKTLTSTITVKNPSLTVSAANEVAVGATEAIKATVKPEGTKVTYTSSDASLATVDEKGVVTGVKAGDVTITAKAGATTKTVKMTVKNYVLKDVKQTKANAIEAVIAGATKNVKPADIKIVNTANNVTYAVKEITVDEKDSTKTTITTYMNMTDGKEYKVTIDGVDKTFTASDGKVVAAGLEKTEIVAATATKINAVLKDSQGVVLDTIAYPGDGKTTISINVINGYTTADSLYLNKVGDTATADVVYHSGQYDTNGNETGNVEAKGITITAIAAETVTVTGWAVKVGDAGKSFDKVTETKVAVGDKKVAYIQMTNSKNEKITNIIGDYPTVESSNKDALIIDTTATDLSKGEVVFSAVKEGTTYLLVKDNKGNVVTTLPITITAARKATTLELDKKDITLSTSISEEAKIAVTLKDQYGEKLGAPSTVELKTLTYNDGKKTVNTDKTFDNATAVVTTGKFDVVSTGKNEGTYVVKVTSNNLSQTFTVTIKTAKPEKPDKSNVSYTLDMPTSSADAIIKDDASSNTEITANVYKLVEGVKAAQITDTEMVVTLKKGNDNYTSRLSVSATGKITITVADKSTGEKLPAGTYTLEVKDVNTTKPAFAFTRNIVITDTQPAVSVKRVGGVKEAANNVNECFEFSYNDKKFDKYSNVIIKYYNSKDVEVTSLTNQDVAVAYAMVAFDVSSGVRLQQKVNIGLTVTIK